MQFGFEASRFTQKMSLLLTLPTELLLRVLGELDCRSLLSCAEVRPSVVLSAV